MTMLVDTSALMKHYISERDSVVAEHFLAADPVLITSRLTEVELRRKGQAASFAGLVVLRV